jgi:signal transduction histidine kinase
VQVRTRRVGDEVEVQVQDNGTGIAEAVRQKIFQPFFTTKPTGEGTGLGLSLAHDIIVQGHGGDLTVASQEGRGTTFTVRLPIYSPE